MQKNLKLILVVVFICVYGVYFFYVSQPGDIRTNRTSRASDGHSLSFAASTFTPWQQSYASSVSQQNSALNDSSVQDSQVPVAPFETFKDIAQAKNLEEIIQILQAFADKYEIKIFATEFQPSSYATKYAMWNYLQNDDFSEFLRYSQIFMQEWRKYPVDWVIKSGLKGIAIVKHLKVSGQDRAAMPDEYGEMLYYDIGYGRHGDSYERDIIHHEFYHMIEEQNFKSLYYKDPKWMALNPPGFLYISSGKAAYYVPEYAHKQHPQDGFVNGYSLFGLEEDKAEVYQYLMIKGDYNKLIKWTETDNVLLNKVNYMKNFIRSISPSMNEEYFQKTHS